MKRMIDVHWEMSDGDGDTVNLNGSLEKSCLCFTSSDCTLFGSVRLDEEKATTRWIGVETGAVGFFPHTPPAGKNQHGYH